MDTNSIIAEFARKCNIDNPQLNADGITFCLDEKYDITVLPNTTDKTVIFHAMVMENAERLNAKALRVLMEKSLLGANTYGSCFGIDPKTGELRLWKCLRDHFSNVAEFEFILENFLSVVVFWREYCLEKLEHPDLEVDEENMPTEETLKPFEHLTIGIRI